MLPRIVQYMVDQLTRDTGVTPTTEWDKEKITLIHQNQHVKLVNVYKHNRRGWLWGTSDLFIDGQLSIKAHNYAHYVRVFLDPSELARPYDVPDPLSTEVIAPAYDPPPLLRMMAFELTEKLGGIDFSMTVGKANPNFWSIHLVFPDGQLRLNFNKRGTELAKVHPVQLVLGDADVSDQLDGRLDKALAMIAGTARPNAPTAPAIYAESASPRSNAVEVRKQSVMRI
jgi:hypothetical protein